MKKFLYLFLAFFIFTFLLWQRETFIDRYHYLAQSHCEVPITYRVGSIDPEYEISRVEFGEKIQQAVFVWQKAYGKKMFEYDPQSLLTVNLIYSEGQSAIDEVDSLQNKLDGGLGSINNAISEFEDLSNNFETRADDFNRRVLFWNEKGGAPAEVYQQLMVEQEDLEVEAERLKQMAAQLNLKVSDYNFQVGEFNQTVRDYNLLISQRPEAGLYDGMVPKIDIYITLSDEELVHTLAHEFGHALGLDHIDDPTAMMFPFSSEVLAASPEEVAIIQNLCQKSLFSAYLEQKIKSWQKNRED